MHSPDVPVVSENLFLNCLTFIHSHFLQSKLSIPVLDSGKNKELERMHLKFGKTFLNSKQSTCTMSIYGELCRYPIYMSRHTAIVKYWC